MCVSAGGYICYRNCVCARAGASFSFFPKVAKVKTKHQFKCRVSLQVCTFVHDYGSLNVH
jgi:hypothetical protein